MISLLRERVEPSRLQGLHVNIGSTIARCTSSAVTPAKPRVPNASNQTEFGALARVSISLPDKLLHTLDRLVRRRGIPSRSHAVAVILNRYIAESAPDISDEPSVGNLTLAYTGEYDVHRGLAAIHRRFNSQIISSVQVALAGDQTLQVMLISGTPATFREINNAVLALRGVLYATTQIVPLGAGAREPADRKEEDTSMADACPKAIHSPALEFE